MEKDNITDNITHYADLLGALGSQVRLMIIRLLVKKYPEEMIAGELQAHLKISKTSFLRHLQKLTQQGLLKERVELRKTEDNDNDPYRWYSLDVEVLEDLLAFFYAECCVQQRVVNWGNVSHKKDELIAEFLHQQPKPGNLENILPPAIYDRLGGKAMQALLLARSEAIRLDHNFIGTEQILLGLLGEGSTDAAKLLQSWGLELTKTRENVKKIVGRGRGSGVDIPFTPKAKQVLQFALKEAMLAGQLLISTEHILMGLIDEWESSKAKKKKMSIASALLSQLEIAPATMNEQLRPEI